jgi:hypothetical protein
MTEEEAKTKWCPMVRDVHLSAASLNVGSGYCKASACMMWRWFPDSVYRDGYCGLADRPEQQS